MKPDPDLWEVITDDDAKVDIENDLDPMIPDEGAVRSRFQLPERIKSGDRHVTLFKLLRSQKARGMSCDAAVAACQIENEQRCDPSIDRTELNAYLKRAWDEPDQPQSVDHGRTSKRQVELILPTELKPGLR